MNEQLRRRSVGAPAARSVLLTLLGEYVLPRTEGVWTETLVRGLGALDYKPQAARQALARSTSGGWLTAERRGRKTRLTLTPQTAEMLTSGAHRIYSFGEEWTWDGRWLVVVVRVPEQRREVRHQVRTRLAWAGFGSLGGGLWISPHAERETELRALSTELPTAELLSFRAELGTLGKPEQVIAGAWDLDAVAGAYDAFLDQFKSLKPKDAEATFRAQSLLVHHWRRFPFLDPDLPDAILPKGWPRARAHALFADRHAAWNDEAQAFVDAVDSSH